jgi:hypothetical protein
MNTVMKMFAAVAVLLASGETAPAAETESTTPAALAASERKSAGCASTLLLQDVAAAMGNGVRQQPVFANGELKGWRLYGIRNSAQLRTRGIAEGSLMTHVCGVPAREIFVNDSEACCAVETSKQFDLTIRSSGEPIHLNITRAPQEIAS